jgi:hypothetical protein
LDASSTKFVKFVVPELNISQGNAELELTPENTPLKPADMPELLNDMLKLLLNMPRIPESIPEVLVTNTIELVPKPKSQVNTPKQKLLPSSLEVDTWRLLPLTAELLLHITGELPDITVPDLFTSEEQVFMPNELPATPVPTVSHASVLDLSALPNANIPRKLSTTVDKLPWLIEDTNVLWPELDSTPNCLELIVWCTETAKSGQDWLVTTPKQLLDISKLPSVI